MDLELTEDQTALELAAEQMLERSSPFSLARELLDGGGDTTPLWGELVGLGWYAVGLEEDDPFGVPGLCLLAERLGAHASPSLLVDTAVAARIVVGAADGEPADGLAEGSLSVALAVVEPGSDWSLAGLEARVERGPNRQLSLTGKKLGVHHARFADLIAAVALVDGAPGVVLVPPTAPGCTLVDDAGLDRGARACRIDFEGVVVDPELVFADHAALEYALRVGAVATAAEGVGAAGAALELAVAYALERRQFGRAIGSFQALQHVMADLHVLRETAWASILYAAAALEERRDDAEEAVGISKAHCSRAIREVVEGSLQVLGGIAFTWEHDVHLLQRRVLECERRFGDAIHHEDELGRMVLGISDRQPASRDASRA